MEQVSWVLLCVIQLIPAVSFFLPKLLTRLYGVDRASPLHLLLQHRAGSFFGVFLACVWCAVFSVKSQCQLVSLMVIWSIMTFLFLYIRSHAPPTLRPIAIANLLGLPFALHVCYVAWK